MVCNDILVASNLGGDPNPLQEYQL